LIFGVTLFYLIKIFREKGQKLDFHSAYLVMDRTSFLLLGVTIVLMFVNWGLESIKWKYLISKIEQTNFSKAIRAVLYGQALNNWVPYGIADYGGRLVYVGKKNRKKALYSVFLGNWAKFVVSFGLGSVAFLLYLNPQKFFFIYNVFVVILFLFLIYSYFNTERFLSFFQRFRLVQKIEQVNASYIKQDYQRNLLFSLLRYLTYILQYFLILKMFHVSIDTYNLLLGIFSIFFIQSFLPAFAITELGIRGAVIIFIFGKVFPDVNILIFAAFTLWFINVLIPSLIGLFFIVTHKKEV
jgi:hypothetical protein